MLGERWEPSPTAWGHFVRKLSCRKSGQQSDYNQSTYPTLLLKVFKPLHLKVKIEDAVLFRALTETVSDVEIPTGRSTRSICYAPPLGCLIKVNNILPLTHIKYRKTPLKLQSIWDLITVKAINEG